MPASPLIESPSRRLVLAAAGSLALHAGVLAWVFAPRTVGDGGAGPRAERLVVRVSSAVIPPPRATSGVLATTTAEAQPRNRPREHGADSAASAARTAPAVAAAPRHSPPPATIEDVGAGTDMDPDTDVARAAGNPYFAAHLVDVRARPLDEVAFAYPPEGGYERGYLVLQLLINEHGVVDAIEILVSDPPGVFDAAASAPFRAARFKPAQKNGVAVKQEMIVEVTFEPPVMQLAPGAVLTLKPTAEPPAPAIWRR